MWLLTMVSCFCALSAQDSLTIPQKKSVLLEEYTGYGCGNCPDGARMASVLKEIAGERFHIMAIHAGHYAEPVGTNYPDYRTDFGQTLLDSAGDIGFPCGSINRYQYEGNTINMFRSQWTKATKQALAEDAVVNLSVQAVVDAQSRRLQVNVRYCFTQEWADGFALLNVALLQNHIEGYQNGGGAQYDHNHMLRHLLTGQWGDTLHRFVKGEVVSKQYSYALPDSVNSIFMDVRNLEIVAFVTAKDGKDVMNVAAATPRIDNLIEDLQVSVKSVALPSSRYGYDFVFVELQNKCNDTLKTLLFAATVNGKDITSDVSVQIPPYQTQTVRVPLSDFAMENSNTLSLRLKTVNEKNVETDEVEYSFMAPVKVGKGALYLDLSTDLCGDEVLCSVYNRHGEKIWSRGPFKEGEQTVLHDTIVLNDFGVYAVEFSDHWRDGWLVAPKGSYKLRASDGTLLGQNYSVQNAGDIVFFEFKEEPSVSNQHGGFTNSKLSVRATREGFEIVNPDSFDIQCVEVFSMNGACMYRKTMRTSTNKTVDFTPGTTQMWIVGIKTSVGTKYEKLIK